MTDIDALKAIAKSVEQKDVCINYLKRSKRLGYSCCKF